MSAPYHRDVAAEFELSAQAVIIATGDVGRPKRRWPRCEKTGKQRFGELKDTKHALEAARHLRAKAELLGHALKGDVAKEVLTPSRPENKNRR